MRVRVRGRGLGSRDHHCLSGRDAGYGFRDGISRDLSIFPRFSHFLLFLMTLGSRGARSASRDSKLSLGWRILSIFKVTMLNTCDPARKCKIIQGFWANVAFSPGWMLGLGFGLKCDLAKNNKYEEITAVTMLNTCDPVRKCKIIQGSWANVAFSLGFMSKPYAFNTSMGNSKFNVSNASRLFLVTF